MWKKILILIFGMILLVLPFVKATNTADFDGSTGFIQNASQLQGLVDGDDFTLSFWMKIEGGSGTRYDFYGSLADASNHRIGTDDIIQIRYINTLAADGVIIRSSNTYTSANTAGWIHVIVACDTSDCYMFINNTEDGSDTVHAAATLDFTRTTDTIGKTPGGIFFDGCLAEYWFDTTFINVSIASERAKFITTDKEPVSLGADGSTPTGSPPIMYFNNAGASFEDNKGSGGEFDRSGTIGSCSNAPPDIGGTTSPAFGTGSVNKTNPRTGYTLNYSIIMTDETALDTILFAHNQSGWKNISNTTDSGVSFNYTVTDTVTLSSGETIGYQFCANDSLGNLGCSSIFTVLVAGTTPPTVTLNSNNFFKSNNKSFVGRNASRKALLNLTFEDDISLFGFQINISDPNGRTVFNLTNTSLSGISDNFIQHINVSGPQGFYTVNITPSDTHTAQEISDYEVNKGIQNYLLFDKKIRITAEGAIYSNTEKHIDRYDFRFNYLPLIAPRNKVFYVESDSNLYYIQNSEYKAHFVDYKNKRWIDFEGIEENPTITKIHDKKWKVEFENADSKLIFSSIGGLNEESFSFKYYLSNFSIDWQSPTTTTTTFIGSSFTVKLNVTGNARNFTQFNLYNSSNDEVQTKNLSNNGTGSFIYETTFSGLTDTQYFVNATHVDLTNENKSSTTLTFNKITLTNCDVGFPTINFTLRNELNSSRVRGDSTTVFDFNGTTKNFQFTKTFTNQDNFSICIFPPGESLIVDYEITYEASGFPQRVATASDVTFNNITKTTDLFLLRTVDGIFATFRLIDSFQNPLPGITASFSKSGTTIETRTTDDAGIVSFFVNPDTTYIFSFTKTGFLTSTNSLRVTTTDIITITLQGEAQEQVTSFATGISYFFEPRNEILNNNTDVDFKFNLSSSFWNITKCTLRLKNASEELAQGDCQFNGSKSNVSITFNTGNQSIIIAEAEYEINGTTNNTVSNSYRIDNVFEGSFSLKNFLDDITSFSEGAFDDFNRFLIAIFITLILVGGLSLSSVDFREPEILIPVTWLMVAFFSYLGWMNIPLDTIPQIKGLQEDWLNRWNVFILISLLGGAYLIKKHMR